MGRRMNMVQTMYIHVYKCRNDTCWTARKIREGCMSENSGRVNSSMIYLMHYKNLCKCYNVSRPSTTIK
jgi:hypothetical protein